MADWVKTCWGLRLLVLFSLLSLTELFEVRDNEWEELRPDIAALHRLRGLHYRMSHEISNPRNTFNHGARVERSISKETIDQNPMGLQEDLEKCHQSFTSCVIQKKMDIGNFFDAIDKHKIDDKLMKASEISDSYSRKLLIMTDYDKSTHDRALQEYSVDPHYSQIVSKNCLNDVSCLPEANGNTVVKIFGTVSEDGQTVSGLSGSSLAELMLKPSLKAAPVFSIDGNTSSHFQYSFIRIFMVRGVKAVLQINKGYQQIYQVMNEPGSVSQYDIPLRPIDHSTQYDHQQILAMDSDAIIRSSTTYLYDKHPSSSSVYALDNNRKPKVIKGDSVPLTEDSRLVLVGHGMRESSGEMKLSGYTAQEVAEIIKDTSRVGNEIKTISVVACEVGSDNVFVETLLKELHEKANIKTELHLRDAVIQVRHTGEKITQGISTDGTEWRHKDDSVKVVANFDRDGNVIVRTEPGSRGEAVFTNERATLGFISKTIQERFKVFRDSWPTEPRRFIDQNVFEQYDQNALNELEALSWGFFHRDLPSPRKVDIGELQQIDQDYILGKHVDVEVDGKKRKKIEWISDNNEKTNILSNCYEMKSGEDMRSIIRHYAKTGEDGQTFLMVNDWIFLIDPQTLYAYPVGKKLNNNDKDSNVRRQEIEEVIKDQVGSEHYHLIKERIVDQNNEVLSKTNYVKYVKGILTGEHTVSLPLTTEAWCTSFFTASIISESARNFRTFPLVLMGLDMVDSKGDAVTETELNFFFDEHPMARPESWVDPSRRGFSGTATHQDSSKTINRDKRKRKTPEQLTENLKQVLDFEVKHYKSWKNVNQEGSVSDLLEIAGKYKISESNTEEVKNIVNDYKTFKEKLQKASEPRPSTSMEGYNDGPTTTDDLISATNLENSFKLESHFSRLKSAVSTEVYNKMREKYGEQLAHLTIQDGSMKMENGEFICRLESKDPSVAPDEFRALLSPESQQYNEQMSSSIETAVEALEHHGSVPSRQGKALEHTGTAIGVLGLMLGLKGAVNAFEQGDVKDGVMGALQTTHGVAAMTTAVIAGKALSAETRMARAVATIMRTPAAKVGLAVIPVAGIGFGIYNIVEDLKRGDNLGYIDAAFDITMVALDVLEIAQPELTPIIAPINLALSVIRMMIDDFYMSIENELNSLPKDAGVLEKVTAFFKGLGKGILHFMVRVASIFYDWHYQEIEEGHRLVAQIADYHKYYKVIKEQDGVSAIDFTAGDTSWNGGGIDFILAEQGQSKLCMDYFVSSDEKMKKQCWNIDTQGSQDIILGLGESRDLEYKTLQKKVLMFIPAGSVTVVSGYKTISESRYGKYKGNSHSNRFFAIQKAEDKHVIEVMLSYYYTLYGEPGDDTFFLGPQRSSVQGSGGKDTYIIPPNGGKTIINNYDDSKAQDLLHFSVDYSHISVSKSGQDLVLTYEGSHTVIIESWFVGEAYRHMSMLSGDGVLFEISPVVVTSVQLVAKGINIGFKTQGETVDASQPLLNTVINIFGSRFDDTLIGNAEKNLMDGGGGHDRLLGGDGEDIYVVKIREQSSVLIENYSTDKATDLAIIEANLHSFKVTVVGDDLVLNAFHDNIAIHVTLVRWFRSSADQHLLVVTKDLITFAISEKKADCQQTDPFSKCIKSLRIDYSSSPSSLGLDLEEDEALNSVTEIRGSDFNDVIRGNKEHNVISPGKGLDYIQGRGGEDWYVITPGQGVKTIDNLSPDLVMDFLFLKEKYKHITCSCEGQSIVISVKGRIQIYLHEWFLSKKSQHLQIKTSDGVTAGLITENNKCGSSVMLPLIVDYRDQEPQPLDPLPDDVQFYAARVCYLDWNVRSDNKAPCTFKGQMITMKDVDSVKEMYGSSGFDIIFGNNNDNVLDPYTGGALMYGGEGEDNYIIKHGYGDKIVIYNYADDEKIDTIMVDMDFLDGSQVSVSLYANDLKVEIITKEEQFRIFLFNYIQNGKYQHLQFLSSDGVNFKLESVDSGRHLYDIEAFKVTLKQTMVDCHLDLNAYKNLSKVHTVQGCPHQSNNIIGNAQDNVLMGGMKDDALDGGEGDDTLIGGNGNDILAGDLGDDTLYGEEGNDTMIGNSGQDVFIPGPGEDLVDGGPGRDTVVYRGDPVTGKGVYVNLLTGQGRYADAEGDVLKDVETVIGTIYADILVSGYESALLKGSEGNDILVSTGGDYLVGGEGNDIYMLAFSKGSVIINNCAKDKHIDVIYLNSQVGPQYESELLSDRLRLTFFGPNQIVVSVELVGRTSEDTECGHLKVVCRGVEDSTIWLT